MRTRRAARLRFRTRVCVGAGPSQYAQWWLCRWKPSEGAAPAWSRGAAEGKPITPAPGKPRAAIRAIGMVILRVGPRARASCLGARRELARLRAAGTPSADDWDSASGSAEAGAAAFAGLAVALDGPTAALDWRCAAAAAAAAEGRAQISGRPSRSSKSIVIRRVPDARTDEGGARPAGCGAATAVRGGSGGRVASRTNKNFKRSAPSGPRVLSIRSTW